jgi:hypothetical protein
VGVVADDPDAVGVFGARVGAGRRVGGVVGIGVGERLVSAVAVDDGEVGAGLVGAGRRDRTENAMSPEGLIRSATDDIDEAGGIPPSDDRRCLYLAALAKLALADTLRSEAGGTP